MSRLSDIRSDLKRAGIPVGELHAERSQWGEYAVYEDGVLVGEGYAESASEIKADYLEQVYRNGGRS